MSLRLLLLPGMDGTGDLFQDFLRHAPASIAMQIVAYPRDRILSYDELVAFVRERLPRDGTPYVLLGESFSGPIAVRLAAEHPPGLIGIILVASFLKAPVTPSLRAFARSLLFSMPPPRWVIKRILLDADTPPEVIERTRQAIASVKPQVLAARAREILNCNVEAEFRSCRLPLAALVAGEDRIVKEQGFKGHIIPGPHLLIQRHPRRVLDAIAEILSSWHQPC